MNNRTEAQSRTRDAQQRVDAAIKELEAAKAALEAAGKNESGDGRVIMKPSEVPVGEYFKFVDEEYFSNRLCWKIGPSIFLLGRTKCRDGFDTECHDDRTVYLTDPYGNAIEPCEKLPYGFTVHAAQRSIADHTAHLSVSFDFSDTQEGYRYWERECLGKKLSPSAAAKLRGMIHKWNKENGGQG